LRVIGGEIVRAECEVKPAARGRTLRGELPFAARPRIFRRDECQATLRRLWGTIGMADADLDGIIRQLAKQQNKTLTGAAKARRDHYLGVAAKAKDATGKARAKELAKAAMEQGLAAAKRLQVAADNAADSYARAMRKAAETAAASAAADSKAAAKQADAAKAAAKAEAARPKPGSKPAKTKTAKGAKTKATKAKA